MAQSSVQNIATSSEPVSLDSVVPKNGANLETDVSISPPADLIKNVKEWSENNVMLRKTIDTKNGRPERPHSDELFKRNSAASILEVKEHAHTRLAEELEKAKEDLQLKDEECKKLSHVQEQMGKELEELTASLFEEANKMVQDANIKRMNAEKLQKESQSKIDVLQAEVTALKELVITSTPSMPNRHLHPQISNNNQNSAKKKDVAGVASFVKGHRRSTSHHSFHKDIKYSVNIPTMEPPKPPVKVENREIDPECFDEFLQWKKEPDLTTSCFFLKRIVEEDVKPCMRFRITALSEEVLESVVKNSLTIEPVVDSPFPRKCALTDTVVVCKYKIRCKDAAPWHFICQLVRNRITAVCDFYTYIRYISQGLVKSDDRDMYWEIVRLRKMMSLAKLGL